MTDRPEHANDGAQQPIPVGNAGLVLLAPYVPQLFSLLALTSEQHFTNAAAADRAVRLLQYVTAPTDEASAPDSSALASLFCGLPVEHRTTSMAPATAEERAIIDDCLQAMITHWTVLGNTSVSGLRETFLARPGILAHSPDGWTLTVEPRPFDMLLDRLPWSYATIRFPWMPTTIQVNWR